MLKEAKNNWIFVSVACAILFQGTVVPAFFRSSYVPNLAFSMCMIVALTRGKKSGIIAAAICGLFQDIFMGQFIGMNVGVFALFASIVGYFEPVLFKENTITPFFIVTVTSIFQNLLNLLIVYILGPKIVVGFGILFEIFIAAIINAFIASFVYWLGYVRKNSRHSNSMYL